MSQLVRDPVGPLVRNIFKHKVNGTSGMRTEVSSLAASGETAACFPKFAPQVFASTESCEPDVRVVRFPQDHRFCRP